MHFARKMGGHKHQAKAQQGGDKDNQEQTTVAHLAKIKGLFAKKQKFSGFSRQASKAKGKENLL